MPFDMPFDTDISNLSRKMKNRHFTDVLCEVYESFNYFLSVQRKIRLPPGHQYLDVGDAFTLEVTCINRAPVKRDFLADSSHRHPDLDNWDSWLSFKKVKVKIRSTLFASPLRADGTEVYELEKEFDNLGVGHQHKFDFPMKVKRAGADTNQNEFLATVMVESTIDYDAFFTFNKKFSVNQDVRTP